MFSSLLMHEHTGLHSHSYTPHLDRSAAEVTGNSFYYLMKEAALLELALIQYAMQKAVAKVLVDHCKTERLSTS